MKNWEKRHLAGLGSVVFSFLLQCKTLEVRGKSFIEKSFPTYEAFYGI